jgi:hypothetical protein
MKLTMEVKEINGEWYLATLMCDRQYCPHRIELEFKLSKARGDGK